MEEALDEQLGQQRAELRDKQEALRKELGEISRGDTVLLLATGKEHIVEYKYSDGDVDLKGLTRMFERREVLLVNTDQKALRSAEREMRRALAPLEDRVVAEHTAKMRAPVDEAEELLRSLALVNIVPYLQRLARGAPSSSPRALGGFGP